ncbi:MAG: pyridoxamine 5'-phosphate oxidase family protein [Bacteroidota bacterium]|nr:pyridoxamine 5'-phosphate oxidase family protein [Bacteroidota bacterium]
MKHRTLTNPEEIRGIIGKCQVCQVGMSDENGNPYTLPMNFAFTGDNDTVWLHSSRNGKKMDILKKNPKVCISFSTDYTLRFQNENIACSYSMKYRSVLIFGKVEFIEDPAEKADVLNRIMTHYVKRTFRFAPPALREVCCWKVKAEKIEARDYGY